MMSIEEIVEVEKIVNKKEFCADLRPEEAMRLREEAVEFAGQVLPHNFEKLADIGMAVGEALSNAVEYGFGFSFQMKMELTDEFIIIEVANDINSPFMPDCKVPRVNTLRTRGLAIMRRFADKLEIHCVDDEISVKMSFKRTPMCRFYR